ncbi:MAG: PEP/pyruvate-binding domain-containing protein [Candidatus Kaelpia imicola]|nr:PEP/pyruvate-binding domain-containing protein [Candidatus Kaelpia imicola]
MKIPKILYFGLILILLGGSFVYSRSIAIGINCAQFNLRRSRDLNELTIRESYSPDELTALGYSIAEVNLQGLVNPEPLLSEDEYIAYQVTRDGETIGWIYDGMLLDTDLIRVRYKRAVGRHALLDSKLASGGLNDEEILSIDQSRHEAHLKAILLGSILGKDKLTVELDIITQRNVNSSRAERGHFVMTYLDNGNIELRANYKTYIGHQGYQPQHGVLSVVMNVLNEFYENNPDILAQVIRLPARPMPDGSMRIVPKEARIEFSNENLPLVLEQMEFLFSYMNDNEGSTLFEEWERETSNTYSKIYAELMDALLVAESEGLFQGSNFKEAAINMLGQKGYNLYRMKEASIPVSDIMITAKEKVTTEDVENTFNKSLGVYRNESGEIINLLVSVRSSPVISMPGILNTVLNVGLTEEGVELLAEKYGEEFAYQTYACFLCSFAVSVFSIDEDLFDNISADLGQDNILEVVESYKTLIEEQGFEIPQDPYSQLEMAIASVDRSWSSEQANLYRFYQGVVDDRGAKVVIQEMKFGNLNENSGSFVLFTRHPVTSEEGLYVEYAPQSQGDELVGGAINPISLEDSGLSPEVIAEIKHYAELIEQEFGYVQDIEGVVEDGKVWITQTRDARLSPEAEVKVLVDLVNEEVISKEEALLRAGDLEELEERLSCTRIDPSTAERPIAEGLGASSGAVVGVIALTKERAQEYKDQGLSVILIREEVSPSDLEMMRRADGLFTHIGGMLSHAAILGRLIDLPTITGSEAVEIDIINNTVTIADRVFKEGDYITIDGTNGRVYVGEIPLVEPEEVNPYLEIIRDWSKEIGE